MKVKEFIKKSIEDLTTTFDNIRCSYRYDQFSETHYIEIMPSAFFRSSNELSLFRADIFDDFDSAYPNQSIVFISEESLTKIGKSEYSIEGKSYTKSKSFDLLWFKKIECYNSIQDDEAVFASDNNYALAA